MEDLYRINGVKYFIEKAGKMEYKQNWKIIE